ncbi:hypothetical protein V499_03625 [Pseudogymnoascus sp. VKM F-103]|nr:hypothetical protein V499_03625 [Pseudogymnoascus sp. VKM F-103]
MTPYREHQRIPLSGNDTDYSSARYERPRPSDGPSVNTALTTDYTPLDKVLFLNGAAPAGANTSDPPVDMPLDLYPSHLRSIDLASANARATEQRNSSSSDGLALPARAVGLSLLEIYFTRIYNAHLLFCKPILFQEYLEGKVPTVLLKAIFAFLAPRHGVENESSDLFELRALGFFHSRGLSWAKAATKEAMSVIVEEPSLAVVQTLECLTLYWFGTGNSKSGDLCLSLAYRFCSIWDYGKKITERVEEFDISLKSELERRCLWACWASVCIVAEPKPFVRSAWTEMAMRPLPSSIFSTPSGWEISLGERMDAEWSPMPSFEQSGARRTAPALVGLMKIIGIWAKVQLFVTDLSSYSTPAKLDALSTLSDHATSIYHNTAPASGRVTLKNTATSESDPQVMLFDAFYYLCQITLHSSIVPLFSGSPLDPHIDAEVVRSSAQAALRHAELFTTLLMDYLDRGSDITCVSPVMGYGAFIASSVLLAFEISCRDKEADDGERSKISMVEAIVRMLDTLRIYWRSLHSPYEKLRTALKAASLRQDRSTPTQVNFETQHGSDSTERHPRMNSTHPISPVSFSQAQRESFSNLVQNPLTPSYHHLKDMGTMGSRHSQPVLHSPLTGTGESIGRDEAAVDNTLMTLEGEWWNLQFAAAGIEFEGFEPMNLFRQGSDSFG